MRADKAHNLIILITHGRHALPYLKEDQDKRFTDRYFKRLLAYLDGRKLSIHDAAHLLSHPDDLSVQAAREDLLKQFSSPREQALILLVACSNLQELICHLQRERDDPEAADMLKEIQGRIVLTLDLLDSQYRDVVEVELIHLWFGANQGLYQGTEYAPPPAMLQHRARVAQNGSASSKRPIALPQAPASSRPPPS